LRVFIVLECTVGWSLAYQSLSAFSGISNIRGNIDLGKEYIKMVKMGIILVKNDDNIVAKKNMDKMKKLYETKSENNLGWED
jgi:hypothetical protein